SPLSTPSARPPVPPSAGVPAETVWVTSSRYRLGFATAGAELVRAELPEYRSFAAGDSGRPVQLVPAGRPLLAHSILLGADTVSLAEWSFTPSVRVVRVPKTGTEGIPLTFTAERGGARVTLDYVFRPGEYEFEVRGKVTGLGPQGAVLLVGLGDGLRSVEADSMDDFHHFGVVTKAGKTQGTSFQSLKPGSVKVLNGPFDG